MEELDKVKSIRKVRMKSGVKYLFVFRVPRIMTKDEYGLLSADIMRFGKRLQERMGITFESLILSGDMTLDIVEKEEASSNKIKEQCRCHCHSEKDLPAGVQCKCIKNCEHCHPENFKK